MRDTSFCSVLLLLHVVHLFSSSTHAPSPGLQWLSLAMPAHIPLYLSPSTSSVYVCACQSFNFTPRPGHVVEPIHTCIRLYNLYDYLNGASGKNIDTFESTHTSMAFPFTNEEGGSHCANSVKSLERGPGKNALLTIQLEEKMKVFSRWSLQNLVIC